MSFTTTAVLLTWVAILLLGLVVSGLIRQVHALTGAPSALGPAPGTAFPGFTGPALLLFLDEGCPVCSEVLAESAKVRALPVRALFAHEDPGLFDRHSIPVAPFGVVLDAAGRVRAAGPLGSADAVHELVGKALEPVP
ncbi:hypothetical protein [Rhizohabitans arisaemae]|uniref:hypothetical protein n=1 Tax=Rhizohabitans arisaemae TaxID=2720610 RepID=UPI0024B1AF10|nr:hypothetical protein [Rhizohabitans arisaemae]